MRNIVFCFLILKATGTALAQTYPTWGTNNYPTNIATNYPPLPSPASFPPPPANIPTFNNRPALAFEIVRSNGSLWSELTIRGKTWTTYVIESSTNLTTWSRVAEVKTGIFGGRFVRVPFKQNTNGEFFRLVKH